jgi:hypothetical protein
MTQNPFEPGASVLESAGGQGPGAFEPPSSLVVYALYASAGIDALQIPMTLVLGEGEETLLIWGMVGLVQFALIVGCIVLWCMWKVRAAKNIRAFSDGPFEFTPGWAAGWYFVPFLNLVRPYQAMNEIMAHSRPEGDLTKNTPVVGIWWGTWIVSNLVENVAFRVESPATSMIASVAGVIAAIFAVRVVNAVNEAQIETARMMPVR